MADASDNAIRTGCEFIDGGAPPSQAGAVYHGCCGDRCPTYPGWIRTFVSDLNGTQGDHTGLRALRAALAGLRLPPHYIETPTCSSRAPSVDRNGAIQDLYYTGAGLSGPRGTATARRLTHGARCWRHLGGSSAGCFWRGPGLSTPSASGGLVDRASSPGNV